MTGHEKGWIIFPKEADAKAGQLVEYDLKTLATEVTFHYDYMPTMIVLDITSYIVELVYKTIQGAAGTGGANTAAYQY